MRIETCYFCSQPVYPSKGSTFIRNDSKLFHFCRSKCRKNFNMKRNPRKLRWTKSFRAAAGKEMTIDSTLTFASKRNIPVRYDRDLMNTTLHAMSRVSEIRAKRERVFYRKRMQGNKERQREADRKLVAENEHLLPRQRASERLAEELVDGLLDERELRNEGEKEERRERISGMVRARVKQRLLVDGDIEEEGMDVD